MEKSKQQLVPEVIDLIIESLNLHFVKKEEVSENTQLMAEGLGLDSVDILEIVVAVEQQYGVKIVNAEQGKHVFRTIGTICDFILANRAGVSRDGTIKEQSI